MHLEALTSKTKKLWPNLKQFSDFVLAGGTALALQLGHRVSVDFDLFSEKELPPTLLAYLQKQFKNLPLQIIVNSPEQLTVSAAGAQISFIAYPFPLLQRPRVFGGVKMMSVPEIGAAKAYALGRRATYKDYVDLFFIVSGEHARLQKIISLSQKKYGENFDARLFLEELVYLEDVPETPIEFLKKPVSKEQIEVFFQKEVKKVKV